MGVCYTRGMFESRDLLNYVIALSVLVLTFLSSWILVYIIKIFRQIERMVRDVIKAVERLNEALDFAKDKLADVAGLIPLLIKGGEKVSRFVKTIRRKKEEDKNKKRKSG